MDISRMKRAGALAALLWAAVLAPARAVPPGFNIQGRLTDANGVNREGNYSIKFTLYDAPTGGTALWTRTYPALTVRNGNFQTVIGDVTGQPMLSDVFASGDARHLEIQVLSGPGVTTPEQPLVPRQQLVSVPYAMKAAVADSVLTPAVPPGTILLYAAGTSPAGFMECNGAAVSRSTYSQLFAAIGTIWGRGDGSTTFNLPDLRGVVPRGWNHAASDGFNDPDASVRTHRLPGGAIGDNVGSFQMDELKSHTHSYNGPTGPPGAYFSQVNANIALVSSTSGEAGGNETRPRNAYVMYIIKY